MEIMSIEKEDITNNKNNDNLLSFDNNKVSNQENDKIGLKEKMEIMSVFKRFINNNAFVVNENINFSKQFIKDMIINNNDLKKLVYSIKDVKKLKQKNNKNILSLIKNNDTGIDSKLILNDFLPSIKFLHNEPQFIEKINQEVYKMLLSKIVSLSEFNGGICRFLNGANNFLDVKEMLSLASVKGKDNKDLKDHVKIEIPSTSDIPPGGGYARRHRPLPTSAPCSLPAGPW